MQGMCNTFWIVQSSRQTVPASQMGWEGWSSLQWDQLRGSRSLWDKRNVRTPGKSKDFAELVG